MPAPDYIADSLKKRVIFYTGKGGVGKTSLVLATALALGRAGRRVAVASWNKDESANAESTDPFHHFEKVSLDTLACFKEYALKVIRFEKIYDTVLDNHILKTFILAAPGLSDTVVAGKILDLYEKRTFDTLLVDLPSSGHALSFFRSPLGVRKLFPMGFVRKETERICEMFQQEDVRLDLVSLPEELPVTECLELHHQLSSLHSFHFGFLLMNQMLPELPGLLAGPPTKDFVSEYRLVWGRQKENTLLAARSSLPIIELPKIAAAHERTLIEKLSTALSPAVEA